MLKSNLYAVIVILGILSLASGACTESPAQSMTATPLEVPSEGSRGEYITVILQLSSDRPCVLVLSTVHKSEIDNYLAPWTSAKNFTYPDNNKVVVWHERIPWDTPPGGYYVLKVQQMTYDGDEEGKEIFSQAFLVK